MLREVERASSKGHRVISVRLDDAPLPPDFEYFLSANHWLDASNGRLDQIIPALIASVQNGNADNPAAPTPPSSARLVPRGIAIAFGWALLAVICIAAAKLWWSKHVHSVPALSPILGPLLGPTHDPRALGEKLDAAYLVEGSVRKAGNTIRVTAQLIDTRSTVQLWADSFDGNYYGVLELQKQIASGIARALQLVVESEEVARARGRQEEALRRINASISTDPLNPYARESLGQILFCMGDLERAEPAFRKSLELTPLFDGSHYYLGIIAVLRGQADVAHREVQAEVAENARDSGTSMEFFARGQKSESDAALARLKLSSSERWPSGITQAYAFRHDWQKTFEWLENSFEMRDPDLMINIRGDPLLAPIRRDPRFVALWQKMNLSE